MTLAGTNERFTPVGQRSPRSAHHRGEECACDTAGCAAGFADLAAETGPTRRLRLRNRLVEAHLRLANNIAARYRRAGLAPEDLTQAAALALVAAADRFQPHRGVPFSAFAVPTIAGTLKRYLRDHRWALRTPRRVTERHLGVRAAVEELTHRRRRAPTVDEIAAHLGCETGEVLDALRAEENQQPVSLDAPVHADEPDGTTLAATLGQTDHALDLVDEVESLRPLLAQLPPRQLRVVTLRFYGNLTQTEIAARLGCSQM